MILSASRRTDIPAFFSDWFLNRIKEQYALTRNPMNPRHISRISLSPEMVDCIVFWTKNPRPMLEKLSALRDYMYYFQFTLNAYERDLEENLPSLEERIRTFQDLAALLGKERVIWRYDPVIVNEKYTVEWHGRQYRKIAEKLDGCTQRCIISFVDLYAKTAQNRKGKNILALSSAQKQTLALLFSEPASSHGMALSTCAEDIDLSQFGVSHSHCVDSELISRLLGCSFCAKQDKNQRPACGCAESVDIGLYNTCQNGCVYCYANHSPAARQKNLAQYDPYSPLLCSRLSEQDKVTQRKAASQKDPQLRLF